MCIIAIKPAGVEMPAMKTIENCWHNNPDGAGIMYAVGGTVHIEKGFMTLGDFRAALKRLENSIDTTSAPIVLHCRITTHGGTSPGNTHPFPVTEKLPLLQMTKSKAPLAVAHNGIIDIKPSKRDISDTMEYVMAQLAPLYQLKRGFYKETSGKKLIYNAIKSKMVFLDGNGRIETVGDFIAGEDGLMYSNNSYKARTVYYKWDLWDYGAEWYESEHGKYLSWLTEEDGYILSNGVPVSADYYLTDSDGRLYLYDIETDTAIPIDGTLYSHAGRPINGFQEDFAEYVEIQYANRGDDDNVADGCYITIADTDHSTSCD
jgi:predicted glutamine amidotransferase